MAHAEDIFVLIFEKKLKSRTSIYAQVIVNVIFINE